MKALNRTDIIAGLLFACLALLVVFVLIPIGVDAPRKVKFAALHPAYYPRIVGYCLLLTGIVLITIRLFSAARFSRSSRHSSSQASANIVTPTPTTTSDSTTEEKTVRTKLIMFGTVATILLLYFLLLPTLGFVLLSTLVLLLMMLIAGERNPVVLIAASLCVPMFLYLFFTKIANIPIPSGVLQPLLVG